LGPPGDQVDEHDLNVAFDHAIRLQEKLHKDKFDIPKGRDGGGLPPAEGEGSPPFLTLET